MTITWRASDLQLRRYFKYGAVVVFAVALISLIGLRALWLREPTQHFVYLADAFAHGSFAVDNLPPWYQDKVVWNGHTFIPLGPMPGILLAPIVAVTGLAFDEIWASLVFTLLNVWLLNRILVRLGINDARQRVWLLILFFCGTIYLSCLIQGSSWFLSHILTTLFLLLALDEGLGKKRAWLVGFWLGGAFLTRATAVLGIVFFLVLWWREKQLSVKQLIGLALGVVPALVFFAWYNSARFGSPFETGYGHAVVLGSVLTDALSYGLFSPIHIPKNLYALLLATPQPVPSWNAPVFQFPYVLPSAWGMSIFLTTPAFVFAFRARWQLVVSAAWLAVIAVGVPLMLYYGIGWIQFGYRYALDFYPFLFIPTVLALDPLWSGKVRAVIILCVLVNLWGAVCSLFGLFV